jgi:hypothetical protein
MRNKTLKVKRALAGPTALQKGMKEGLYLFHFGTPHCIIKTAENFAEREHV